MYRGMTIYSLLLLFVNLVELRPGVQNENRVASERALSDSGPRDAGVELHQRLDEAAQKALDIAEEARNFADEAQKYQSLQDVELRQQRDSLIKDATLLQNYRTAIRNYVPLHLNATSRVKRMDEGIEMDEEESIETYEDEEDYAEDYAEDDIKAEAEGEAVKGGEGDDKWADGGVAEKVEGERGTNDEGTAGVDARGGSYSPAKIEIAKKQLARSDRLLQKLVRTFAKILVQFGEEIDMEEYEVARAAQEEEGYTEEEEEEDEDENEDEEEDGVTEEGSGDDTEEEDNEDNNNDEDEEEEEEQEEDEQNYEDEDVLEDKIKDDEEEAEDGKKEKRKKKKKKD